MKKALQAMKVNLVRIKLLSLISTRKEKRQQQLPQLKKPKTWKRRRLKKAAMRAVCNLGLIEGVGDNSERAEGPRQKHAQL